MKPLIRLGVTAALALSPITAVRAQNIGLLGGVDLTSGMENTEPPLGILLSAPNTITNLHLYNLLGAGDIASVAINDLGMGLLGGQNNTHPIGPFDPPFLVFIPSNGVPALIDLSGSIPHGYVNSVAINASGLGLVGGQNIANPTHVPYAFTITSSGSIDAQLTLPVGLTSGDIFTVAINDAGIGIAGGGDQSGAPLGLILHPSSTTFTNLDLSGYVTSGFINSVAINASGTGFLGGQNLGDPNRPALVFYHEEPSTTFPLMTLPLFAYTNHATFTSVAINDSGVGILGGYNMTGAQPPIAFLVSPTGDLTDLMPYDLVPTGSIFSVAINNSGHGLIGGTATPDPMSTFFIPFAFIVTPTGELINLHLEFLVPNGEISSVAINESGVGLIGGYSHQGAAEEQMAFVVCPTGGLIRLDLSSFAFNGDINSVALNNLFQFLCPSNSPCQIPTQGLSKNEARLANYINKYAPYVACYLLPLIGEGKIKQALESTVPTAFAIPSGTSITVYFTMNNVLSQHSSSTRQVRRQIPPQIRKPISMEKSTPMAASTENMLASINMSSILNYKKQVEEPSEIEERPFELWGSVLGALSYQKAESQTPAFNPSTGGIIVAFDAKGTTHARFGGGAAYAYTHIHEKKDAGHANINQESLFLYALWDSIGLYFDAALWGGLCQIDNVRNIKLSGLEFQSKSHPKGWQLAPHFELGYDVNYASNRFTIEPFVRFDWVSNWQDSYKEKGSGPFNMGQKHHYSSFLRSEAGVRFYETVQFTNWRLISQEGAGYVNKKPFKVGTVNAFIVGAPGSFTVETFTTTQNLGVGEFQLIFDPNNPRYPYGTIAYEGEFGSMYQSHQVSLNITWNF